jgi:hypothetical protein
MTNSQTRQCKDHMVKTSLVENVSALMMVEVVVAVNN